MASSTGRLRIYECICPNGHEFEAPHLGDFAYGLFLAFSPSGEVAFVDAFSDPVFDEVVALVDETRPSDRRISDRDRAEMVRAAFCMTLDPDPAGPMRFDDLRCPTCGAKPLDMAMTEPARWLDDVPPATHAVWATLPADDKRRAVAEIVRRTLE